MGIKFCNGGCDNENIYWLLLFFGVPVRYDSRARFFSPHLFSRKLILFGSKKNDKQNKTV